MKGLNTVWTRKISDPKKKEEFEKAIRASTTMAQRLLEILDEEEASLDSSSLSVNEFDNPNWALKQAYLMGDKARIKKLRDLLSFIK